MFLAFRSPHYEGSSVEAAFRGKFPSLGEAQKAAVLGGDPDDDCEVYDVTADRWLELSCGEWIEVER